MPGGALPGDRVSSAGAGSHEERYPLLGPDLHRLDRTGLRLAHSFNHLVGDGEDVRRNGEAERFRGREVDNEFEFGCLEHR